MKRLLIVMALSLGLLNGEDGNGIQFYVSKDPSSPAMITAAMHWPKEGPTRTIDAWAWHEDQWGPKYLIQAFGLESYKPTQLSVVIARGIQAFSDTHKYEEMTHYLYNPDKTKVCILLFKRKWVLPSSGDSHSYISIELVGCHNVSKP